MIRWNSNLLLLPSKCKKDPDRFSFSKRNCHGIKTLTDHTDVFKIYFCGKASAPVQCLPPQELWNYFVDNFRSVLLGIQDIKIYFHNVFKCFTKMWLTLLYHIDTIFFGCEEMIILEREGAIFLCFVDCDWYDPEIHVADQHKTMTNCFHSTEVAHYIWWDQQKFFKKLPRNWIVKVCCRIITGGL